MSRKILFWQWNSFMGRGVEQAFHNLNLAYDTFYRCIDNWEEDENFSEQLESRLQTKEYQVVFSINFCPVIAEVCENNKIKYIAWVYDSPMNIRNLEAMNLSYTSVWIFDRGMVEQYNRLGYRCRHLPLAVSPQIFKESIRAWDRQNEIAFVGKLYQTDYAKYMAFLPEYRKGYLNGLLAVQGKMYGAYLLEEVLTDAFMEELNAEFAEHSDGQIQLGRREFEFLLASEVTARERFSLLSLLAGHHGVDVYSDESEVVGKARRHGYVDYYSEMPGIFANTKINLNISLKAIRTGIPLRVIDIMGCGGFVLSNYQEEIMEYMHPGIDCEVYESLEDAYYKAEFYLKNEELRQKIAQGGAELMQKEFTFEDRVKTLLDL